MTYVWIEMILQHHQEHAALVNDMTFLFNYEEAGSNLKFDLIKEEQTGPFIHYLVN